MKKYRLFSFLLLIPLVLSMVVLPASALEEPDLICEHAILVDANYGEILLDKGANDRAYPASITKVMTALLVLEAIESGQLSTSTPITAGDTARQGMSWDSSTANIQVGETLSVEDLLYCLMLPSANEAANILAVAVDGTIEDFVAHMNRKAGQLGCKGTHFVNPNGLHDDQHYTTAYDISLYMKAALEYDLFRTIIATDTYRVPATNMSGERLFYNTNGLISNINYRGYVYDKCIGGKTGTTDEAGRCLVAAAEDGETLLISVILGSGPIPQADGSQAKQGQFTESTKLLKWGFNNFHRVTITKGDDPVESVAVTMSRQADEVLVKPQGSITRTLPRDLDLDLLQSDIRLFSKSVEAPVEEGQVLGTMTLSYEGEVYGTIDLVAVTSVERSDLLYQKEQFLDFFRHWGMAIILGTVMLIALLILLRMTFFRRRRRNYRSKSGKRVRGNYRGRRY